MAKQQDNGKKIRILVSDGTAMASSLLVQALSRESGFQVLPPVNPSQLGAAITDSRPQVVVLSMNVDEKPYGGCEIVRELRALNPELRAILLLDNRKRETVLHAFQAGARGVFCRTESAELLVKCIEAVHGGQIWANSSEIGYALEALIQLSAAQLTRPKIQDLFTGRELEVVRCVAQGLSNREIAGRLGLSEHTVKNYLFRMFDKLGVSNRVELLLCSLAQLSTEFPCGDSLLNDSPAVAFDACLEMARRFALSQCMLRDACRSALRDPNDRVAAYTWALITQKMCGTICEHAAAAAENLASGLAQDEAADAMRRMEAWFRDNGPTMAKYLPAKNVLLKGKAFQSAS